MKQTFLDLHRRIVNHRLMRLLLLPLIFPILVVAEDKAQPAADAAKKHKLTAAELRQVFSDPEGRILTDWMGEEVSTALWRSFTKAGYTVVLTEGKMEGGQMLFRQAYKHAQDLFPGCERPFWHTYIRMPQDFFENKHRELLKDNYTLMQM